VGFAQNLGAARAVIVVAVTDEQDLDVAEVEAEDSTLFLINSGDDSRLLLMRMSPFGVTMR